MINLSRASAETGIDERLLLASLELTINNNTLNDLLHIDKKFLNAATTLVNNIEKYPNLSQFLEENSKVYGDIAEKILVSTLGLEKAKNSHFDGYHRNYNNRIEIKVTRPLMERKKGIMKSFAQRAHFFDPNNPCKGNGTYQHVKPDKFDILLGAIVYMDATVIHLIESNKINSSILDKDYNPSKIKLHEQQADQETEGYVKPNDMPIVAIIRSTSFDKMNTTMDDLMEAYINNDPILITNESSYIELDSVLGW